MKVRLLSVFILISLFLSGCTWATNDSIAGKWTLSGLDAWLGEFQSGGDLIIYTSINGGETTKSGSMKWKVDSDKLILSDEQGTTGMASGTYYTDLSGSTLLLYSDSFKQTKVYTLTKK